jgi:hypothetical protein
MRDGEGEDEREIDDCNYMKVIIEQVYGLVTL